MSPVEMANKQALWRFLMGVRKSRIVSQFFEAGADPGFSLGRVYRNWGRHFGY